MTSNRSVLSVLHFVLFQTAKFMLSECTIWSLTGRPAKKQKLCDHFWLKNKLTATRIKIVKIYCSFFIRQWWFQCTSFFLYFFNSKYEHPYLDTLFLQNKTNKMDGHRRPNAQNIFSIIIAHYCDLYTFKTDNIRLDPSFMSQCQQKNMIVLPH